MARSSWILRLLAGLQVADEFHNQPDLFVSEHAAERRHTTRHAVLDTIEQKVVAVGVIHQLRTLPLMATVVLVTETADIAEGRFHVEWRSPGRLLLRGGREGRPRHRPGRGQGDS